MVGFVNTRRLALTGVLALMVAACGSSSSSAAPSSATGGMGSQAPAATAGGAASQATAASQGAAASQSAGGDAIAALSGLNSYKIKMSIASKGVASGIASMGNISMDGTVVAKPEKASDITMKLGGGDASASSSIGIRYVEVNGKTYLDMGTGTLTEATDTSQTSIADSLSPDKLLGATTGYLKDMKAVGDETKNGLATTHYTADASVLKEAAAGLAMLGMANADWKWDVWIAKDGGYVVSYLLDGTGADNAQLTMSLDISDVNSPSNVVKGP